MKFALATVLLAAPLALAQTAAPAPAPPPAQPSAAPIAFDAVTIRPSTLNGWNISYNPDGVKAVGVTLHNLVAEAYDKWNTKFLTGGPSWSDTSRFDVEAKFDPATIPNAKDLTHRQRADMLRQVLADRFKLKVHFETKNFPIYNLVIANGGPKLPETPPDHITMQNGSPTCLYLRSHANEIKVEGCTMQDLVAYYLPTGRTVIDKTGLTARYTINLVWTPDNTPPDSSFYGNASIFTAVQEQLGLKLLPSTAPLDILVIDSAEKPSEN